MHSFLSSQCPFKGTREPNKLTCPQLSGFVSQLVEHCTAIAEVMGTNPVKAAWIFQMSTRYKCEDYFSLSYGPLNWPPDSHRARTISELQVALEGNFGFVQDKSDLKSASDKKIVRKDTVALENKICEQNITPCCPSTNRDTRDLKMFSADEDVRRKKV